MNVAEIDKEKAIKNAAQVFGVSTNAITAKYNRLIGKKKDGMRIVKTTPLETRSVKKSPIRMASNYMVLDIKKVDIDINKGKIKIIY
jgi:hypothetical protein